MSFYFIKYIGLPIFVFLVDHERGMQARKEADNLDEDFGDDDNDRVPVPETKSEVI